MRRYIFLDFLNYGIMEFFYSHFKIELMTQYVNTNLNCALFYKATAMNKKLQKKRRKKQY